MHFYTKNKQKNKNFCIFCLFFDSKCDTLTMKKYHKLCLTLISIVNGLKIFLKSCLRCAFEI